MLVPVLQAIFPLRPGGRWSACRPISLLAPDLAVSVLGSCGRGLPDLEDRMVEATIRIDASQRLNPISDLLYPRHCNSELDAMLPRVRRAREQNPARGDQY